MTAVRPRSLLSPLHVGLSVLIHRKFGCKTLIEILHNLGYSASYKEAQLYEVSALFYKPFSVKNEPFVQFVADNADYNIHNLTGRSTFHYMGSIIIVTPACAVEEEDNIERLQKLPSQAEIEKLDIIHFIDYNGTPGKGLDKIKYLTDNRKIDLKPSYLIT